MAAFDFLLGAAIATLAAIWFKADRKAIENGMFAFGGGYVGLLVGTFASLEPTLTPQLIILLILRGILAVPVTSGLGEVCRRSRLSAAAFPIILLVWALLAGILYTDLPQNSVAP